MAMETAKTRNYVSHELLRTVTRRFTRLTEVVFRNIKAVNCCIKPTVMKGHPNSIRT
jgi:hypothetical protein